MSWKNLAVAAAITLLPSAAGAQQMPGMEMPAAECAAVAAPPAMLAGWSSKQTLPAAGRASDLGQAAMVPGKAMTVTLHPTREVHYVAQPEKPGGSVAYGGLLSVTIADAGTYQVNLGSGAWIDVLKDGAAVVSSAHKPGPACTGIRKTVQFPLQPGAYVLQISANAAPALDVMVSRVP